MIGAWLLGVLLVIALPWRALSNSRSDKPARRLSRRLFATISEIAGLLLGLGLIAVIHGVSPGNLGLAWPPPRGGQVGLLIAASLIGGLLAATLLLQPRRTAREEEAMRQLPQNREETLAYLAFTPFAGFGWEILYRGFLLWWLVPLVGIIGAVVIASLAYGLAHGWKSRADGIGSILSAFMFTIGYALTGSLWWLIAIHTALPLIGLIAGWRARTGLPQVQKA